MQSYAALAPDACSFALVAYNKKRPLQDSLLRVIFCSGRFVFFGGREMYEGTPIEASICFDLKPYACRCPGRFHAG